MKILLIADVHDKLFGSLKTIRELKKVVSSTKCDLIVFLGDTVHGPSTPHFIYKKRLHRAVSVACGKPFATVFGNHDDECSTTKEEILGWLKEEPNCLTKDRNYFLDYGDTRLLFIDSGSYCKGDESGYAYVDTKTIKWAKEVSYGKRTILFQHIIMPDIMELIEESDEQKDGFVKDGGKWYRFKDGVSFIGSLGERPCPPDFNNRQLEELKENVCCAVFGHDHLNDFELDVQGVRFIQCAGAGSNSYDRSHPSSVKLLDTNTLETIKIPVG